MELLKFNRLQEICIKKPFDIDATAILGELPKREIEIKQLSLDSDSQIRSGTVIYSNSIIGKRFETGHNVVIRENCIIGDDVKIWSSSTIDYNCQIGFNVKIHCNVYISQETIIENNVFIGPGVLCINDKIPVCLKCAQGPIIRSGARIGAGAIIMPGVVIGKNALVGAGSVVTSDVPENAMVYGNPAVIHGSAKIHECRP